MVRHSSRVLPGRNANTSTALATFVEPSPHRSDGSPSSLPNSSVVSPVAHSNKSGVSSFGRTRVAAAETSEKRYCVPWVTGGKSEPVSSGNCGMAAAVLSPCGVFLENYENKTVMDINYFHVSLVHAHSSVLKATVHSTACN